MFDDEDRFMAELQEERRAAAEAALLACHEAGVPVRHLKVLAWECGVPGFLATLRHREVLGAFDQL